MLTYGCERSSLQSLDNCGTASVTPWFRDTLPQGWWGEGKVFILNHKFQIKMDYVLYSPTQLLQGSSHCKHRETWLVHLF